MGTTLLQLLPGLDGTATPRQVSCDREGHSLEKEADTERMQSRKKGRNYIPVDDACANEIKPWNILPLNLLVEFFESGIL